MVTLIGVHAESHASRLANHVETIAMRVVPGAVTCSER